MGGAYKPRYYGDNDFIILTFKFIARLNATPDTDSRVNCSKIIGCRFLLMPS